MHRIASDGHDGENICLPRMSKSSNYLQALKRSFAVLGPGIITGAADDDRLESHLSVAGAAYGIRHAVDRAAHVSTDGGDPADVRSAGHGYGSGLAAAVRTYYPRWVLWGACSILVVANVINIGADLGGAEYGGGHANHHWDKDHCLDSSLRVLIIGCCSGVLTS